MKYIPRYDIRLIRDGRISVDATPIIRTPQDTLAVLEPELSELAYERFIALALSTKNHVIAVLPVSSGSLNASIVHPRELFQRAILSNCASLILAHNHPSGDPVPSPEDIALTRKLIDAGLLLDIPILDHVILGYGKYASFKEMGLL